MATWRFFFSRDKTVSEWMMDEGDKVVAWHHHAEGQARDQQPASMPAATLSRRRRRRFLRQGRESRRPGQLIVRAFFPRLLFLVVLFAYPAIGISIRLAEFGNPGPVRLRLAFLLFLYTFGTIA